MHFAWMVHRWASSRSPTKYTSAASCRVKMACTWKHMSVCPTSRAISWTKYKKGSLQIRRSILFWNQQISQTATVPGWYLQGFFTFLTWRNSFQRALPPTVSQSFLLAGSCPPSLHSHLSQLLGWQMTLATSPNFSASSTLLSNSPWIGGVSTSDTGGSASAGGPCLECTSTLVLT